MTMMIEMNHKPLFTDEERFQRILKNQYEALNNLTGDTQEEHRQILVKMMVKQFYERNQKSIRLNEDELEWRIKKDEYSRPLLGIEDTDGKEYLLSYYQSNKLDAPIQFHSFDTLQGNMGLIL